VRGLAPKGDPNRDGGPRSPKGPVTAASVVIQDAVNLVGNALVREQEET